MLKSTITKKKIDPVLPQTRTSPEMLQMSLWPQLNHGLPSLNGVEEREGNVHPPFGSPSQHLAPPGHLALSRFPRTSEVEEQVA